MNPQTQVFKISLLSISLLTLMAGAAVAPGLSEIAEVFKDYSPTVSKLVITLPPLLIIPFSLLSGLLSSIIGKKKLLISGLIIYLIGGAGAAFIDAMIPLLLFRAVLGIGTGIVLPLSTGLIADFYDGDERTKMLGFSSAFNCLGTILANIAAGILVAINWHYIFFVYFLAVPVLLLVIPTIKEKAPVNEVARHKLAWPEGLLPWIIAAFLVMLAFFGVVTNLSLLINQRNLGDSQTTGYIFGLNSLCMLISGALFLTVKVKLQNLYSSFMLLLMAAGYAGLMLAGSLPLLIISVVLSGLGTGLAFPYVMNQASQYTRENNSILIMSIVSSSAFLGQFFSPLILDNIPNFTGKSISNIFAVLALSAGIIFLITLTRSLLKSKHDLEYLNK